MSDDARAFLTYLRTEYQREGFPDPGTWAFSPNDEEQQRAFVELRGQQLIRKATEDLCILTERGLQQLLAELPMSEAGSALWVRIKAGYAQAGRPKRRTHLLAPSEPAEQPAYNELRARGYLEALPEGRFILSAMGMNRSAA